MRPLYHCAPQSSSLTRLISDFISTPCSPVDMMTLLTYNAMWKWCSVAEEGGVCDPVIDEHFRRSLGKDYLALFSDSGHQKPAVSKPDNTNSSEHSASSLSGTSTTLRHRLLSNSVGIGDSQVNQDGG